MACLRYGRHLVLVLAGALGMSAAQHTAAYDNGMNADPSAVNAVQGTLVVAPIASRPGRIELPYVHYKGRGAGRPTVFFLGGGPGVSNLKFVPRAEWLRDFDVVVLEYRGVGRSSLELDSPHFARGLKKLSGGLSLRDAEVMKPDFAAGFADLRRQGIDFNDFSVDALADDLERLRETLELPQVYLVGHSFGTRIALHYQTRYRDKVAASLLYAMNTPGGFIWDPAQTQSVVRRYRDDLMRVDPSRAAAISRLLDEPAARTDHYGPFSLNDAKALFVAYFLSFNIWTRNQSLDALLTAHEGSGGRWFLMDQSYDWFIRFGFNWADFFLKAYCADCDRTAVAHADAEGQSALFQSPSSVLFAGIDGFEAAGGHCQQSPLVPDLRNTLAINGEFDTTTPIERRPPSMADERFQIVRGGGHADVFYPDHGSAAGVMRRFFLHPEHRQPPAALDAAPPASPRSSPLSARATLETE